MFVKNCYYFAKNMLIEEDCKKNYQQQTMYDLDKGKEMHIAHCTCISSSSFVLLATKSGY